MDQLVDTVKQEICWYNTNGVRVQSYAVLDDSRQSYAVLAIDPERERPAGIIVFARVEDDRVIIEADLTDRPLYRHLMEVGIPREQIVLAYAGETTMEQPA
jgi:hypothetical protein